MRWHGRRANRRRRQPSGQGLYRRAVVAVAAPVDSLIAPTVLMSLNTGVGTPSVAATTAPSITRTNGAAGHGRPGDSTAGDGTASNRRRHRAAFSCSTIDRTGQQWGPSAPVPLLVPFVVGQRGRSENFATLSGTITASGAQSWTTDWQSAERYVGIDEVLAVNANGSIQLRYTTSLIETSEAFSDPDISSDDDPTVLEGIPLLITYGPDRSSTSVGASPRRRSVGRSRSPDRRTLRRHAWRGVSESPGRGSARRGRR